MFRRSLFFRVGITSVEAPAFGRRKRRIEAERQRNAQEEEEVQRRLRSASKESEEDSWAAVSGSYGFALKPPQHSWTSFLAEIRRYEQEWRLASSDGLTFKLTILDRGAKNEHQTDPLVRCSLLTQTFHSHAQSDLLCSCEAIYLGKREEFIPFTTQSSDNETQATTIFTRLSIYTHPEAPPQFHLKDLSPAPTTTEPIAHGTFSEEPPSKHVEETAIIKAVDWSEWLCVRWTRFDESGRETDTIMDVSLQTFIYLQLTSLITFFHSRDLGLPVYELVPRMHVTQDLLPLWHKLRYYAKMHPAVWPIGLNLFKPL